MLDNRSNAQKRTRVACMKLQADGVPILIVCSRANIANVGSAINLKRCLSDKYPSLETSNCVLSFQVVKEFVLDN